MMEGNSLLSHSPLRILAIIDQRCRHYPHGGQEAQIRMVREEESWGLNKQKEDGSRHGQNSYDEGEFIEYILVCVQYVSL